MIVKPTALEFTPDAYIPVPGLLTYTEAVPALAMSAVEICAVSSCALT